IIDSVRDYDIHSGRSDTKSADIVADWVIQKGLEVEWILETHIHADHLTAAKYLQGKLGGKTGVSEHFLRIRENWNRIFNFGPDTPADGSQFNRIIKNDEEFTIGPLTAKMIHVPGHTPADTAFVIGDAIICGDSMLLPDQGTGRCDFPGGSAADSYDSIMKILSYPDQTRLYICHDYPPAGRGPQCMTTVAEQKAGNTRVKNGITRDQYIAKRNKDDAGKAVPKLMLPSIQVNLRGGDLGEYIKLPVDRL
ncbi:MAG: MBL fold metallo-hydrolase, partial [Alphaproteobacteria bacterium]|nr:MBL fold metallo-hydrolase [Alphaproteobacteria bacterium]